MDMLNSRVVVSMNAIRKEPKKIVRNNFITAV